MFPPTFSAALSQQLSYAAQLLSLVLLPRFSHLPHMGLWLGPFLWDTERSLLVTHMPCLRHLAVCTDQQIAFTPCNKQDIPQVTIKIHGVWEGLLCFTGFCSSWLLYSLPTPVPVCWACLCYVKWPDFATCWSASFILPPRRKSSCECVCSCFFDYLWLNMHDWSKRKGKKEGHLHKKQERGDGLWEALWFCFSRACSWESSVSQRDIEN